MIEKYALWRLWPVMKLDALHFPHDDVTERKVLDISHNPNRTRSQTNRDARGRALFGILLIREDHTIL